MGGGEEDFFPPFFFMKWEKTSVPGCIFYKSEAGLIEKRRYSYTLFWRNEEGVNYFLMGVDKFKYPLSKLKEIVEEEYARQRGLEKDKAILGNS